MLIFERISVHVYLRLWTYAYKKECRFYRKKTNLCFLDDRLKDKLLDSKTFTEKEDVGGNGTDSNYQH